MCKSHSLFMEDEHTSIWQPKCDNDSHWVWYCNCDEIQKKIDIISVVEFRKHCPFIPRTFAATFDCPQQKES